MMTKKHYEIIAKAIRNGRDQIIIKDKDLENGINEIIKQLTKEFKEDNARFNENKFIEACKPIVYK